MDDAALAAARKMESRVRGMNFIGEIAKCRASFGGMQSRLNFTISYLEGAMGNRSTARGRIMDADFALETAVLTRAQILQQVGTAMVAQANSIPQNVLSLLSWDVRSSPQPVA
jgi:flagellin